MAAPLVAIRKPSRAEPGVGKVLRSSCRHCRRRKIKCDGNAPCGACRGRRIDCIHDERARMGRPTKDASSSSTQLSVRTSIAIGDLLDASFDDAFTSERATTAFSAAVHGYLAEQQEPLEIDADAMAEQTPCGPQTYDMLFPQLVRELLEACLWQYSSLMPMNATALPLPRKPAYLRIGLRRDSTAQMAFEATPLNNTPLEVNDVELERLYHVWSASHPFAPFISIDSVKHQRQSAQAIRCLLVLEAKQMCGEEIDRDRVRMEYHRAEQLFRAEKVPVDDKGAQGGEIESLLLACQASLLFGWHELAHNRPKRGTTHMAVAGQLMGRLHALVGSAELDKEATVDTIKLTSSFLAVSTVWAFSQLDRSTGDLDAGWHSSFKHARRPPAAIVNDVVTRICSTLLNNHPNIVSGAFGVSPPDSVQNSTALSMHLYPHIMSMQFGQDSDQCDEDTETLIELIRDSIRVILLLPCSTDCEHIKSVEDELLSVFCSAGERLMRLVGQHTARQGHAIYSKLAYERAPANPRSNGALRKTVAAFAYELLSRASERVTDAHTMDGASPWSRSGDWQQVCAFFSQAYLELLETPALRTAREAFKASGQRLAVVHQGFSTPGLTSIWSSDTATIDTRVSSVDNWDLSTADFPLENGLNTISSEIELDESLYNVLWGFLPWTQEER